MPISYEKIKKDYEDTKSMDGLNCTIGNGKVIGEFMCNKIDTYDDDTIQTHSQEDFTRWNDYGLDEACIHEEDLENCANDKWLYGWHISDLKIYDKPKELSEFNSFSRVKNCEKCGMWEDDSGGCWGCSKNSIMLRPPQSYCYVEELK